MVPLIEPVRIVIVMEDGRRDGRWGAGSPDLPNFVLISDSRQQLEADLPAALEAHCGRPVAYRFLVPSALS
jgi:predicted RNase H-like HicB family nuclease